MGNLIASVISCVLILIIAPNGFPRSIYVINLAICLLATGGLRVMVRILLEFTNQARGSKSAEKRTLIYGAGDAGITSAEGNSEQSQTCHIGCWDFWMRGQTREACVFLASRCWVAETDAESLAEAHSVETILIAIPSATGSEMTRILESATRSGVDCKTVPGLAEVIEGCGLAGQIRDVAVEDLLGRTPVHLEEHQIRESIEGRVVLVTGAAGSIGSELCRQIARFGPAGIVGFDIAESPLFEIDREMRRSFPHIPFHPEIGSIQNRARLDDVLLKHRPTVLYHAAAYKHVPLMEAHVFEAIENNVFGTYNLAVAAADHGVEDFVMISSDKAVRPTNVMGATKRVAELILARFAERSHQVRCRSLWQCLGFKRQRDSHLQEADRRWRTGHSYPSRNAPLLHDHSRSMPACLASRRQSETAVRFASWIWASRSKSSTWPRT